MSAMILRMDAAKYGIDITGFDFRKKADIQLLQQLIETKKAHQELLEQLRKQASDMELSNAYISQFGDLTNPETYTKAIAEHQSLIASLNKPSVALVEELLNPIDQELERVKAGFKKVLESEDQPITYVFSVRNCSDEVIHKILEKMSHDAGEECVKKDDYGLINVLMYERDPKNGDNQSLYISEWMDIFPCLALVNTIYDDYEIIDYDVDDDLEFYSECEREEILNQQYMDSLKTPLNVRLTEQEQEDELRWQELLDVWTVEPSSQYETDEREAIQTEHLQPESVTDFFTFEEYIEELNKPLTEVEKDVIDLVVDGGKPDSDSDEQSTTQENFGTESKISFSRVSIKGFYSPDVALVGIGDEIRYIPVTWEDENTATSKHKEVSVSYGKQLSICELQISIDNDGLYSAYPLSRHGGKVQFLAPNENTRYAEIKARILPNGEAKSIATDHKAQTITGVYSRDKVLCRVIKSGKKTLRYPLSGWFESVGGKWLYSGNPEGIYWLDDIQNQLKSYLNIGSKVRHQENIASVWEVTSLSYSCLVLNATCICLKGGDVHKEEEVQVFPIVQLIAINADVKTRTYEPTPKNEKFNNLLDTVALKKAYAMSQARDTENAIVADIKKQSFDVDPPGFDDRF